MSARAAELFGFVRASTIPNASWRLFSLMCIARSSSFVLVEKMLLTFNRATFCIAGSGVLEFVNVYRG